ISDLTYLGFNEKMDLAFGSVRHSTEIHIQSPRWRISFDHSPMPHLMIEQLDRVRGRVTAQPDPTIFGAKRVREGSATIRSNSEFGMRCWDFRKELPDSRRMEEVCCEQRIERMIRPQCWELR